MQTPKIIIDDKIPYIKGLLDGVASPLYLPYAEITHDAILNADALVIRTRIRCTRDLLHGTSVRLIVTATIGMDHIDLPYCRENGIEVRNASGCNAGSVAQWVGEVLKIAFPSRSVQKLGLVGYGNVGKRVKKLAERLGFEVIISDPPLGYETPLSELAETCDVITFHTPLTTTGDCPTFGMAGEEFFGKMKSDGLIINAARGGIVDEEALKRWLNANPEARCAIDCWQNEPHIDRTLLQMAMIATPHIAGYSADGKWNGTTSSVQALNEFFHINAKMPAPLPTVHNADYDILYDSQLLKYNPELFEYFRSHYRMRRE